MKVEVEMMVFSASISIFIQKLVLPNNPDLEIFSMTGTINLDWDTINPQENRARGLVTVQIKGYDPNSASSQNPESIPEPNFITSLLMFGVFGLTVGIRRNEKLGH